MNIQEVLQNYDEMFGKCSVEEIEGYLSDRIKAAMEEEDNGALITLLNELIGFMRDTFQKEKALAYCTELKKLIVSMGLSGTEAEATSYQNIANACRAFGRYDDALSYFHKVEESYRVFLKEGDYRYASLYNNWGLLYQEMGQPEEAEKILSKSLELIDALDGYAEAKATTRINLANSLLQLIDKNKNDTKYDSSVKLDKAEQYAREALELFERDGGRDFHYSAALTAMADILVMKDKDTLAKDFYERSLLELEKHFGKNENYLCVFDKYQNVLRRNPDLRWKSNLERSEEFYRKYGKKMIAEQFPEYSKRIAAGVVGEGSDCFGFDDYISADHDYGQGFILWLTESDYQKIGEKLQKAYEQLLHDHALDLQKGTFLSARRGVKSINEFYSGLFGVKKNYEAGEAIPFAEIEESRLAEGVNGKVFEDQLGVFTGVRNLLFGYYDRSLWLKKIAAELHAFSGYGQSNYPRAMARQDVVTAQICVAKAVESAMNLIYLLNRSYAPYDKWKMKGLKGLPLLQDAADLLREIVSLPVQTEAWKGVIYQSSSVNEKDTRVVLLEQLASVLLEEMKQQKLVTGTAVFLEAYVSPLLKESLKQEYVEKIVALEWRQFDGVKNEGGRASCQDDYPTFSIMRKSQYLTWNEELLQSYWEDLTNAEENGWNLIMEKYARMMESTAKEEYEKLKAQLPVRSEERKAIQEEIIKIQVGWMEEFAAKYPHMASNARIIHTKEDRPDATSYETYLRGELGTYSDETLSLYGRMIVDYFQKNRNLAYEIMTNTAHLYGYQSVAEAEEKKA